MAKQANDGFPTHHAFSKLGNREQRIELVRAFAQENPDSGDVLPLLPPTKDEAAVVLEGNEFERGDGFVYMMKFGKHFKIGKSFSVPRRHRQIALELPEKPEAIHVIATDDPAGIENYWHNRFASKRTNGEWFALDRDDLRAFKRRKFM